MTQLLLQQLVSQYIGIGDSCIPVHVPAGDSQSTLEDDEVTLLPSMGALGSTSEEDLSSLKQGKYTGLRAECVIEKCKERTVESSK